MRMLIAFGVGLIFLTACTTPPMSEEQMAAYERYASLRATDAAASQLIASAKATEAAAVQVIAWATTTAITPTEGITSTLPVTLPVAVAGSTMPVTTTENITSELAITATVPASPTLPATAPPPPTATPTATQTPTPTASPSPTSTQTPSPTSTQTPTPTSSATPTPSPSATAAPSSTPSPSPRAGTPSPASTAVSGLPWPPQVGITATISSTLTPAGSPAPPTTPEPTPTPAGSIVIRNSEVNLRGGPGTEFDVLGTAKQGSTLDVLGSNAERTWWQVCCVDGKPGWVSRSVAAFRGTAEAVPVALPLIPDDLDATWAVRWQCHAEGCVQEECLGQSRASPLQERSARWLEVKREATWTGDCGEREEWITQVDRYSGLEQQTVGDSAPLFSIFAGADPGLESRTIDLLGRSLSLWCTDSRTKEVDEGQGWTAVLEGQACYDRKSGVLITLQYLKRWLFTGEYEGKPYDRQYFGDYEVYQQILTGTNLPLSGD